jgi:hypothetical protein
MLTLIILNGKPVLAWMGRLGVVLVGVSLISGAFDFAAPRHADDEKLRRADISIETEENAGVVES